MTAQFSTTNRMTRKVVPLRGRRPRRRADEVRAELHRCHLTLLALDAQRRRLLDELAEVEAAEGRR